MMRFYDSKYSISEIYFDWVQDYADRLYNHISTPDDKPRFRKIFSAFVCFYEYFKEYVYRHDNSIEIFYKYEGCDTDGLYLGSSLTICLISLASKQNHYQGPTSYSQHKQRANDNNGYHLIPTLNNLPSVAVKNTFLQYGYEVISYLEDQNTYFLEDLNTTLFDLCLENKSKSALDTNRDYIIEKLDSLIQAHIDKSNINTYLAVFELDISWTKEGISNRIAEQIDRLLRYSDVHSDNIKTKLSGRKTPTKESGRPKFSGLLTDLGAQRAIQYFSGILDLDTTHRNLKLEELKLNKREFDGTVFDLARQATTYYKPNGNTGKSYCICPSNDSWIPEKRRRKQRMSIDETVNHTLDSFFNIRPGDSLIQ